MTGSVKILEEEKPSLGAVFPSSLFPFGIPRESRSHEMPSPLILKQLSVARCARLSLLTESSCCSCRHHEAQSPSAAPFLPRPSHTDLWKLILQLYFPKWSRSIRKLFLIGGKVGTDGFTPLCVCVCVYLMSSCLRTSSSHLALFYRSNRILPQPLFARINKSRPLVSTFKIGFPFSWTSKSNPFNLVSANPFFFSSPKLHTLFQTNTAVTFKVPCIYQDDNELETGLYKNWRISLELCSYKYGYLHCFLILRGNTLIHLMYLLWCMKREDTLCLSPGVLLGM